MSDAVTSSDAQTTVAELRALVQRFVAERDWEKFHSPKNLSMALAIEVAELMEHFQWITPDESRQAAHDPARRSAVSEELADVICYALALANSLDIDVAAALQAKMLKNAEKYPVERIRGRFGHDDPTPPTS